MDRSWPRILFTRDDLPHLAALQWPLGGIILWVAGIFWQILNDLIQQITDIPAVFRGDKNGITKTEGIEFPIAPKSGQAPPLC